MLVQSQQIAVGESVFEKFGLKASRFESCADAFQSLLKMDPSAGSFPNTSQFKDYDRLHRKGRFQYRNFGITRWQFSSKFPTDERPVTRYGWFLGQCPFSIRNERSDDLIEVFLLVYQNLKFARAKTYVEYVAIDKATGATLKIEEYQWCYYSDMGRSFDAEMGAKVNLLPAEACASHFGKTFDDLNAPIDLKSCKRFLASLFNGAYSKEKAVNRCKKLLVDRQKSKELDSLTYFDLYLTVCIFCDHHCLGSSNVSASESGIAEIAIGSLRALKHRALTKINKLIAEQSKTAGVAS